MLLIFYLLVLVIVSLAVVHFASDRKQSSLPPGPRGLPIIGNLLDFYSPTAYRTFAEWGRRYGPVVLIKLVFRPCVIINTADAARELMTKSSSTTSNRFARPMADLCGFGQVLPHLQPSNPRMKQTRRLINSAMGPAAMTIYEPEHERRAVRLVQKIVNNPQNFLADIRFSTEIALEHVAYGTDDEEESSGFCKVARMAIKVFIVCSDPLIVWMVDVFPLLRHLPSWLPGMSFKRRAAEWRMSVVKDSLEKPFQNSVKKMEMGLTAPCMVSHLLAEQPLNAIDKYTLDVIKQAAVVIYLGGLDTVTSLTTSLYLALVLNLDVQKRVQKDIDSVTDGMRLPTFADRSALPIIDCVLKELIRWATPTTLAFAHAQDDNSDAIVDGIVIPRRSLIIVNCGGIFEDPDVYADPMKFWPERHYDENVLDPWTVAFGYARRQCIGMHFVERWLWIVIATTMATLEIHPPNDPKAIQPRAEFTTGPMRHPLPFDATFRVRNSALLDV